MSVTMASDPVPFRAWSYMADRPISNHWSMLEDPRQPPEEPPLCGCGCCWEDDCQCDDCPGPDEPDYETMALDWNDR